jgi:F-box protein 11
MSSLADLPKLIGFFSYSRDDDEGDDGAVSALSDRIYRELRGQLGRTRENFRLWRDKDALAVGEHWKAKLQEAVSESVFFITMVTPSAVKSSFCRFEFESFVERERALDRDDLVFPILYITVPELEDERKETDPVVSIIVELFGSALSRRLRQGRRLLTRERLPDEVTIRFRPLSCL